MEPDAAGPARDGTDRGPPGYPILPPGRVIDPDGRGELFLREVAGPTPDAPYVVLLHGLTCTADLNWFAAYGPLAKRYRVVAPDLRGHGGGIQPRRFRLEDAADDVAALCTVLDTGPVVVVGYSMGGAVAQLIWQRHPNLVAGLVLAATAADYRPRSARARYVEQPLRTVIGTVGRFLPARLRPRIVTALRRVSARRLQPEDQRSDPVQMWAAGQLACSDPFQVAAAASVLRRHHSEGWIGGLDKPVALVINRLDTVVATSDQRHLASLLPAASIEEVEAGHGVFVEDPDRFVPALLAAVAKVVS